MSTLEEAATVVARALRGFEKGELEGISPEPLERGFFPLDEFRPGVVGELYRDFSRIEWHPPFDWSDLGPLIEGLNEEPAGAADLSAEMICKLLLAHWRIERFCDGHFLAVVSSGQLRALLARFHVLAEGRTGPISSLLDLTEPPPRRNQRRPRRCRACGSKRIATILYGEPAMDEQVRREIEEGRLVIGGCCITDDDPMWQCSDCGTRVHRVGGTGARPG